MEQEPNMNLEIFYYDGSRRRKKNEPRTVRVGNEVMSINKTKMKKEDLVMLSGIFSMLNNATNDGCVCIETTGRNFVKTFMKGESNHKGGKAEITKSFDRAVKRCFDIQCKVSNGKEVEYYPLFHYLKHNIETDEMRLELNPYFIDAFSRFTGNFTTYLHDTLIKFSSTYVMNLYLYLRQYEGQIKAKGKIEITPEKLREVLGMKADTSTSNVNRLLRTAEKQFKERNAFDGFSWELLTKEKMNSNYQTYKVAQSYIFRFKTKKGISKNDKNVIETQYEIKDVFDQAEADKIRTETLKEKINYILTKTTPAEMKEYLVMNVYNGDYEAILGESDDSIKSTFMKLKMKEEGLL